ncbi:MAG TPA: hypothetical protein VEC36_13620, partial [Patescibacteria group bacterium]|nr:hypothetical protein [Patescibacteria group bacterium]
DVFPSLPSGFLFKHGTFVSRIKFGSLQSGTKTIQAFWLFSPDGYRFKKGEDSIIYINEVNFEWNNFFRGRGEKRLNAGLIWEYNSRGGHSSTIYDMNFFQKNASGQFIQLPVKGNILQEYYTENRWYYYLIRLDSVRQTAEFSVESDEEFAKKIYGGMEIDNGKISPVVHKGNFPRTRMMAFYNCSPGGYDGDSIVREDMLMDVDWFYYTPHTSIEITDAVREVESFKKAKISRINTTGEPTFHHESAHLEPPGVTIEGPDEVEPHQTKRWCIRPTLKNTIYDVEYSYRKMPGTGNMGWTELYTPEVDMYAEKTDTAIEFKSTVKDWRGMTASLIKQVKVRPRIQDNKLTLIVNSLTGDATISLPNNDGIQEYRIEIYSKTRTKISDFSIKQGGFINIHLDYLPPDSYTINVYSGDEIFTTTIQLGRR